ncbi:hypothetical protein [Endozoicomonas sp. ALB091]|uniref:hypothetical protein n=1 Tax=Endozoicomonas sp. ALB091 TaxID=3403073 RepID=UPI003BB7E0EA
MKAAGLLRCGLVCCMRVSGRKVADIVCLLLAVFWWQVAKTKPETCRAFNQEAWSSGSIWISGVVDQKIHQELY